MKSKTFLASVVNCIEYHNMNTAYKLLPSTLTGEHAPQGQASRRIAAIAAISGVKKGVVTLRALALGLSAIEADPTKAMVRAPEEEPTTTFRPTDHDVTP